MQRGGATLRNGVCFGLAAIVTILATTTASADGTEPRVEWRDEWPRFRAWEYVYTPLAFGTGFYLRFGAETEDANTRGGVLFDDAVLDAIALDTLEGKRLAEAMGDAMFYGTFAYRAVDSIAVPLIGYGDSELALQMSMIDLESFGTVALVLWTSQAIVRRERPALTRRCDESTFIEGSGECDSESVNRSRSFIAGHFAAVLTGAGLTCVHHAHIPLYGGQWDKVACGTMIGAAGMTAGLRMMTEDHYPTDTLLGLLLGGFAGWVMPMALHYDTPRSRSTRVERQPMLTVRVLPWAHEDRIGVATVGSF